MTFSHLIVLQAVALLALATAQATPPEDFRILQHPAGRRVETGSPVTFSAVVEGKPGLTFQWLKSGTPLSGQTTPSLTINSVQLGSSGTYSLRVSDGVHTLDSEGASLTPLLAPNYTLTTPVALQTGTATRAALQMGGLGAEAVGLWYFPGRTDDDGNELWVSDGTVAGTRLFKSFLAGAFDGLWAVLGSLNDQIIVCQHSTSAGAAVTSVHPVTGALTTLKSGLHSLQPGWRVGSKLFFLAGDSQSPSALYVTDGTAAGTLRVADNSAPFVTGSQLEPLDIVQTAIGTSRFYFLRRNNPHPSTTDYELWRSDGTAAGTFRLKTFPGLTDLDDLNILGTTGNVLYFRTVNSSGTGLLNRSVGNAADDETLVVSNFTKARTAGKLGSLLYLSHRRSAVGVPDTGFDLYSLDSSGNLTLVKDINAGSADSDPQGFVTVGSQLFFTAATAAAGRELYVTDGTAAGTTFVEDIQPGTGDSLPGGVLTGVAAGADRLFFLAETTTGGRELHVSDGTAAGTFRVKEFGTGTADADIGFLGAAGTKAYFRTSAGATGMAHASNGTSTSTVSLASPGTVDTPIGVTSNDPPVLLNGVQFYLLRDSTGKSRLQKGTRWPFAGTVVRADLETAGETHVFRSRVYFSATDTAGTHLWSTAGTNATTRLEFSATGTVDDFIDNGTDMLIAETTGSGSTKALYASDGSTTTLVTNLQPNIQLIGFIGSTGLVNVGTSLFKWTRAGGISLVSAGLGQLFAPGVAVPAGLVVVRSGKPALVTATAVTDLMPTVTSPGVFTLDAVANGRVYFAAEDTTHGRELWSTNGTVAGTALVRDAVPGTGDGVELSAQSATGPDGLVYFLGLTSDGSRELWRTNGTVAGTEVLETGLPRSLVKSFAGVLDDVLVLDGEDTDDTFRTLWQFFPGRDTFECLGKFPGTSNTTRTAFSRIRLQGAMLSQIPSFTRQPFSRTIDRTQSASFTAETTGAVSSIQWRVTAAGGGISFLGSTGALTLPGDVGSLKLRAEVTADDGSIHPSFEATMTVLDPFETWQRDVFPTAWWEETVSDALVDPDRDGVTNLEEYHFGMNPLLNGQRSKLPRPGEDVLLSAGRRFATFVVRHRTDATSPLEFQQSLDLRTWETLDLVTQTVSEVATADANVTELTLRAKDPKTGSGAQAALYLRASVKP